MSVTFSGGITFTGGGFSFSPPPLGFLLYSIGGNNGSGQLGLNDVTKRSSPVQVGTTNNWNNIDTFYTNSMATRKDGTLWTWGAAAYGILGLNAPNVYKSSPTQVGALTTWLNVSVGYTSSLARKTDGTLWAWGRNNYSQLGINTGGEPRSSPVQVGAGTTWLNISAGTENSLATTSDGKLYAWGRNYFAELGLNNTTQVDSPTQVGALTNWVSVINKHTSTYAIKSDGTLWVWGRNSVGQLGVGDSISRSSPVQVGALSTWLSVAGGSYGGAVATQTNGKLFTWGYNNGGSMGGNGASNSPIQLGADTNWSLVAYNADTVAATKTTGTLWTWGFNNNGQLGQNDLVYRSSPTQVGTGTGWLKVAVSNRRSIIAIAGDPLS
jgi:alpha-tubulin suppressor-like RCC1 family protein